MFYQRLSELACLDILYSVSGYPQVYAYIVNQTW